MDSHYYFGDQSPCPPRHGRILGVGMTRRTRPALLPIISVWSWSTQGREQSYVFFSLSYFFSANSPLLKNKMSCPRLELQSKPPDSIGALNTEYIDKRPHRMRNATNVCSIMLQISNHWNCWSISVKRRRGGSFEVWKGVKALLAFHPSLPFWRC
jgi:hypothetical protein